MSALDFEDLINKNIKELPLNALKEKRIDDYYFVEIKQELKKLNINEIDHLKQEFENYQELYPKL